MRGGLTVVVPGGGEPIVDLLPLVGGDDAISLGDVIVPVGRATVRLEADGKVVVAQGGTRFAEGAPGHVYLLDRDTAAGTPAPGFSVQSPDEALDRFIALQHPREIEEFAERYGLLGLCPQGFPERHDPVGQRGDENSCTGGGGCRQERGTWPVDLPAESPALSGTNPRQTITGIREPLFGWWRYVRLVKGLMTIVADLKSDSMPEEIAVRAWEDVVGNVTRPSVRVPGLVVARYPSPRRLQSDRAAARLTFAEVLNRLLDEARVTPTVEWEPDAEQPRVTMQATLLGQIAQQIVLAAAGAHGLAYCGGCAVLFLRRRRVQRDRRAFCARCRADKVPAKLRQRKRAHKKRAAQSEKAATSR